MHTIHVNDESEFNTISRYITQSKTRLDALNASLSNHTLKAVRSSLVQLEEEFNNTMAIEKSRSKG